MLSCVRIEWEHVEYNILYISQANILFNICFEVNLLCKFYVTDFKTPK